VRGRLTAEQGLTLLWPLLFSAAPPPASLAFTTFSAAAVCVKRVADLLVQDCEGVFRAALPGLFTDAAPAPSGVRWSDWLQSKFATEPVTLLLVRRAEKEPVIACAIYRTYRNTFNGAKFYIEFLHVLQSERSRGLGTQILDFLQTVAKENGSTSLVSSCETENKHAVRFFLTKGMTIQCYCFTGSAAAQKEFVPKDGSAATKITVKHVTNDAGEMSSEGEALLRSAERVHRQLRMALPEGSDEYVAYMRDVFADGGRMVVAVREGDDGGSSGQAIAAGLAVYRFYYDFALLKQRNYVDDLVSDSSQRSRGVGHAIMQEIRQETRKTGGTHDCDTHPASVLRAYTISLTVRHRPSCLSCCTRT
jgi:GNAT superfamily N-acetyltransferase